MRRHSNGCCLLLASSPAACLISVGWSLGTRRVYYNAKTIHYSWQYSLLYNVFLCCSQEHKETPLAKTSGGMKIGGKTSKGSVYMCSTCTILVAHSIH